MRYKGGARVLSSFFSRAFDQRQEHVRVPVFSTFKLPPRVTLTDTKKEAWLADLANPDISLRRLSRTIPHGLRGKILLDRCLEKNVPISRVIWLVKCVGANEIRAFKRKGAGAIFVVGGETKWVKDWTGAVEHFVATLMNSCNEPVWRKRMHYM